MSETATPERIGKYPIIRKLGEGATSEVFLCRDPFNNREVAVKLVMQECSSEHGVYKNLFTPRPARALVHPHIS